MQAMYTQNIVVGLVHNLWNEYRHDLFVYVGVVVFNITHIAYAGCTRMKASMQFWYALCEHSFCFEIYRMQRISFGVLRARSFLPLYWSRLFLTTFSMRYIFLQATLRYAIFLAGIFPENRRIMKNTKIREKRTLAWSNSEAWTK